MSVESPIHTAASCGAGFNGVPHPNATPAGQNKAKTYLEVHFRDVVEPFIHSGLAISGSEARKRHFGQHSSGLGIHLPLQVSYGVLFVCRVLIARF
jgi:hypothetical protein